MLFNILQWFSIIVFPLAAIAILLKRRTYVVATIFLVSSLLFIAGQAYVDLQLLLNPDNFPVWRKYGLVLEVLCVIAGYFYTKTAFRDNSEIYKGPGFWITVFVLISLLVFTLVTPINQLVYAPDFAEEQILFLTKSGFLVYLTLMVFLVFSLVQLERTYTGLHQLERWNIKPEVLGSGLLLAAFALYFSQSLLYRTINMDYLPFRSLVSLIAISMYCYGRLFRRADSKLALSRGIAHRSFVLLIIGGYLVLLGAIGEGLRYLNIGNLQSILYGLILISGLALAGVFLSEKTRRRLKVVLHKNFYQSKYDYQEQWNRFAKSVAHGKTLSDIQSSILDLFSETMACKGASLYLYDQDSASYLHAASFKYQRDWRPFVAEDPLIKKMDQHDWIINLHEDNPDLVDSLAESLAQQGAFLIIPLIFDDNLAGFIVLGEQIYAEEMTYEDYDLLRLLARQAIATIQGLRLSEQLSTTRELAAIGKVSTFVLHDLKNQVSGLSLMHDNARDYIADPDFQQDMLETVGNTVKNMKELITKLKNLKEKPALVIAPVDLATVVHDAIGTAMGPVEVSGEAVQVAVDNEEIYKVILNLLVNALEATKNEEPVSVSYGIRNMAAFVKVRDAGCGMSEEFIKEKLFKPFETTKKHGFGIGLYQCRQIVESHGGSIEVNSKEGEGTEFMVLLPLAQKLE